MDKSCRVRRERTLEALSPGFCLGAVIFRNARFTAVIGNNHVDPPAPGDAALYVDVLDRKTDVTCRSTPASERYAALTECNTDVRPTLRSPVLFKLAIGPTASHSDKGVGAANGPTCRAI